MFTRTNETKTQLWDNKILHELSVEFNFKVILVHFGC